MRAAVQIVRGGAALLARAGISDARVLVDRAAGKQNLQAHARHLVALAAVFLSSDSTARRLLVGISLTRQVPDSVWQQVQQRFLSYLRRSGTRVVSQAMRSGQRLTARKVADTYLPVSWGGTQGTGGGGVSTLKRALRLGAHAIDTYR